MSLTQVLEVLGQEHIDGDDAVEASLKQAVEGFTDNRTEAINAIRHIQEQDSTEFVLAAARLLKAPSVGRAAGEYIAGLISSSNSVVDPLLDQRASLETALSLARAMAEGEPLLDARLMRKMLDNAAGNVAAIATGVALRVLWLLDKFSDCSRVTPHLMQLARHPAAEVQSKAALLLGRGNLNLMRVKRFLGSDDGRLRANAVESLWGLNIPQARQLFREAAADPNRRVAINALVGLCKAGDRSAGLKLIELSGSDDPIVRRGAAWAMGQVGDPGFAATLEALSQDEDEQLRNMAIKSRELLHVPKPQARRWAARAPEAGLAATPSTPKIGVLKKIEDPAPDLHSYPSRPAEASDVNSPEGAEQSINPSAHGEDDTVRDLQSYPLASSSRPGR